jgi:hypothetical protein
MEACIKYKKKTKEYSIAGGHLSAILVGSLRIHESMKLSRKHATMLGSMQHNILPLACESRNIFMSTDIILFSLN